jgi:hypothetical protein
MKCESDPGYLGEDMRRGFSGYTRPDHHGEESHTPQGNLVSWGLYVMYFPSSRKKKKRSGQVRSGQVRSGQVPLQGAVRPCRWWRGLSNRSDARGDAGGSFALLAGSPMPARVERTGEKQRTAQPSGSTTKVVARELANPGEIRATVGRTRTNRYTP